VRGDDAVRTLPEPYVQALQLAVAGHSDEDVATTIGVPDASVPALLQLAAAKLARALRREDSSTVV
jgi:DNA-directed RNA polymerase specialized sigma24 family protein